MCGLLTALHGKDGDVVDRVDLAVQRLCSGDDSSRGIHIEEAFQVSVSVDRVPVEPNENEYTVIGQVRCS